jgi:predicted nucleic acid-binding protein
MSRSTAKTQSPAFSAYVLDSFAFLISLCDENGAERVQSVLDRADRKEIKLHASSVSIAEVYYITKRRSLDPDPVLTAAQVVEVIENLPIQLHGAAKAEALAAARLKAAFPISSPGAFAAALAKSNNAKIMTGNRNSRRLRERRNSPSNGFHIKPEDDDRNEHSCRRESFRNGRILHVAIIRWGHGFSGASSGGRTSRRDRDGEGGRVWQ